MLKYLIIGSLLVLLLLLVYSKLHPYIKMLGKFLGTVRSITNAGAAGTRPGRVDGKLVKCVSCGTWVPAGRAVGIKTNSVYCSTACLEKSAAAQRHKAVS
ncbi:MAG TPA: hypothetical protein VJV03_16385 [Pyrinomonadaceae bacterium]|nr:hypothetical protein [Pyrinomonadaceae bacterium]